MITSSHDKYEGFIRHYWQYYKELENEILNTRRYVDFDEKNKSSFSVEYLKLYQAICSEVDVLGKTIAAEINPCFKPEDKQNNIYKWWLVIQDDIRFPVWDDERLVWTYVALEQAKVDFFCYLPSQPWKNFRTEQRLNTRRQQRTELVSGKQIPKWWSSYNKVKHHRTSHVSSNSSDINYTLANLGNVADAAAALYILEMAYMHAVGTKDDIEAFADNSCLFEKNLNATTADISRILDGGEL